MRINYVLLGAGIAVLIIGIVLNAKHHDLLGEELKEKLLREAMPSNWSGILTIVLIGLLMLEQSLQWTLVLVFLLILESAYFARKQYIRLSVLGFPQSWLRQKRWVDLVFFITGILVISAILYPKYQIYKYHW
jgi:uncharacterized membrane protein